MNARHRKTLQAVFEIPTRSSIVFSDIETLMHALGAELRSGDGSRIVFAIGSRRLYLHRPHPGKEAKRYQVEQIRTFLTLLEIVP